MKKTDEVGDAFEESGEEQALAMQKLINSGIAWRLEGSVGRAAMGMIKDGVLMLGMEAHKDYWGNVVPSRYDVQAGTVGSYQRVAEKFGTAWADRVAALGEQ